MLEFLVELIAGLFASGQAQSRWRWVPAIVATSILLVLALITWWMGNSWGAFVFVAIAATVTLGQAIYFRFARRR